MAVDKKSDHVGNHGGAYTDNDGNRKQFTVIDHDKKPSISAHTSISDTELEEIKKSLDEFTESTIEFVLLLPAVNIVDASGGIYNALIKMEGAEVVWDKKAVRAHLEGNINSFLPIMLWRRTVPEIHWFHPMRQEDDMEAIRNGEWKNLIP